MRGTWTKAKHRIAIGKRIRKVKGFLIFSVRGTYRFRSNDSKGRTRRENLSIILAVKSRGNGDDVKNRSHKQKIVVSVLFARHKPSKELAGSSCLINNAAAMSYSSSRVHEC
jgi:hypothetical protein